MYSHAGEDKSSYMEKWEFITRTANALSARRIINIDSVLQQYMYIHRAEEKVYVRDGNQPDVTVPGLRRYYTIDQKSLLKQPLELCDKFEKIVRIWDAIKDYPVVKLLLKFNDNTKIFLVSYLNRFDVEDVSEEVVTPIAECLLRLFTVLELVDAGYSSSRFKTFLFGENIKLVDKSVSMDEIINDFTMHITKQWSRQDIYNCIKEYDKNILVFLNEYLYAKAHGYYFNFNDTVNIEHIMPASGHNIDAIRLDAGIETREEFAGLANLLGNKILLEEDINKSISNEWFKTKKQKSVNDKTGYKDSKYNIARALVNYPSDLWTKKDIEDTTTKVAEKISDFIFAM